MSLFGSGAECSTGSNPLAQFTKHASSDTAAQQSFRAPQQDGRSLGGVRNERVMSTNERHKLDSFMRSEPNMDAFNFRPMAGELPNLSPQHTDSESMRQISPPQRSQQSQPQQRSQWLNEFNSISQQGPQQGVQRGSHFQGSSLNRGMRTMPLGMNRTNIKNNTETMDSTKWDAQFQELEQEMSQSPLQQDDIVVDDKDQATFNDLWKSLNKEVPQESEYHPQWENDFTNYASGRVNYGEYKYSQENQFLGNPDAYTIGLRLMENGAKLSEAALAFEAAVQENSQHVDAWLRLGQVQTQNEKEIAGISALERCLDLDRNNLAALMSLAISYVNEGYDNAAYATLERWIETKYPDIAEQARRTHPQINDEDRYSLNKRITELFIRAAQLAPTMASMDSDVQTGLGVLFYSMEEFDKTLDCFRASIAANPNDALAWNRLGAALANSNRSEEALDAYLKALNLNPNFVRARYNLGVSCINMGLYKEAVEYLLGGLSMHRVEGADESATSGTSSLLETLKRAFLAMDRRDLIDFVKPGMDLSQFRGEFNF